MIARRHRAVVVAASGVLLAVGLAAWVAVRYAKKRPHEVESSDAGESETSVGEPGDHGYTGSLDMEKHGEGEDQGVGKDGEVVRGVFVWERRRRQFLEACESEDKDTVRLLLESGKANVDARYGMRDYKGQTVLIHAALSNHTEIVRLLIDHGADVNAVDPIGNRTALHRTRDFDVAELLIQRKSQLVGKSRLNPNVGDVFGDTPLHGAVEFQEAKKVALLLDHGAVADAVNKEGLAPIHFLLQVTSGITSRTVDIPACHDIAQALVSRGAKWDDTCDELTDDESMLQLGFRVALLWWIEEHKRGVRNLTDIPEEVLMRGPDSVMQYVAAIRASDKIVLRRKVCVVGPSFWGKTSLVKSISTGKPVLQHVEDRTIGIDQCAMSFSENVLSAEEQLRLACRVGNREAVGWFLESQKVDPDIELNGTTPLVDAILANELGVVEALLTAGADPNVADSNGDYPLFLALRNEFPEGARLLLRGGAQVNNTCSNGDTALHCCAECPEMTAALLEAGGDVRATNERGESPFHRIIEEVVDQVYYGTENEEFASLLQAARLMVSYGATWHTKYDSIVLHRDGHAAQAFREVALFWMSERDQGSELTLFPVHVFADGPSGVREFVAKNARAEQSGESTANRQSPRTSSQQTELESGTKPVRSYGSIPTATLPKALQELNVVRHHEITFWDFAGQEAYQVAHSPFFSKRTLYLVCVDLHAYAAALEQTELRADRNSDIERLMNEFVDSKILRWIRLILSCQPDAEFVFVGTKADVLVRAHEQQDPRADLPHGTRQRRAVPGQGGRWRSRRIVEAHADLEKRLSSFADSIENKSCDSEERFERLHLRVAPSCTPRTTDKLYSRALGASAKRLRQIEWIEVNCTDNESIRYARDAIEQTIIKSKRSFQMPGLYSQVLEVILKRREGIALKRSSDQVLETFQEMTAVSTFLRKEIPKQASDLSDEACGGILRALHDIGDILWFEELDIDYLKHRVILHPLILIEFVRQIVHHNHNTEAVTHKELEGQPYWDDLDAEFMLVMKQLLRQFHLVHPAGAEMKSDSDLIVPAFWRSRESALWLFLGDLLKNDPSLATTAKDFCVQWEYHFTTSLPDVVFDAVVIESYSQLYERHAGPDWVMYNVPDTFACRVVVTRASRTSHRVLRVEAIASKSATDFEWGRFKHLCKSLEKVLSRFRGLAVSRRVVDDTGGKSRSRELDDLVVMWMETPPNEREPKPWLPPCLKWYYDIVRGRAGLKILST